MDLNKIRNQYRKKLWIEFREEIIELDGYACVRCGKSRDNGSVLQVHHKQYIKGNSPWEYPLELCETLCKGCHASEHGIIRPEHGWDFIGEDDLGGLHGNCERCGTEIRYAFHVHHPHWEPITVGTVCCDDLTSTKLASKFRKFDERLKRFYKSHRWKYIGDDCLIKQKRIDIRIYKLSDGYKIQMGATKGVTVYPSIDDAKRRVFEFIESGEADGFFKNRSKSS